MKLKIGDRVRYSGDWLRSAGIYTGEVPFKKGEITELRGFSAQTTLAIVKWDSVSDPRDEYGTINTANLERTR